MVRFLTTVLLSVALSGVAFYASAAGKGDARFTQQDVDRFNEVMAAVAPDRDLPMDQLIVKVARQFLGTPYVAGTLETEPEQLTVNMRETDCILFVEMCLALALTAKNEEPSFDSYVDNLRELRYRDGVVDGYASRLHYTSEWIAQGAERGLFREVTRECGGKALAQKFNFMSTHPASYKQLANNPSDVARIRSVERTLESRDYWYIPKADLPRCAQNIRNGDIIAFCSTVAGLDIAHIGIAYRDGDKLTFIHASTTADKVIINPTALIPYINSVRSQSGIRVIRLSER
ncbi:MAG: DUF1460 domain-containing protein [Bacteroidales bacterium]|nr:DUF1460 domain-containing protein [Bacteroidales bacterium]